MQDLQEAKERRKMSADATSASVMISVKAIPYAGGIAEWDQWSSKAKAYLESVKCSEGIKRDMDMSKADEKEMDSKAKNFLIQSLTGEAFAIMNGATTAREGWLDLEKEYGTPDLQDLMGAFIECKLRDESENPTTWFLRLKAINKKIGEIDPARVKSDDEMYSQIYARIKQHTKLYSEVITNIDMSDTKFTLDKLKEAIKAKWKNKYGPKYLEEQNTPDKKQNEALNVEAKKHRPPKKFKGICNNCGKYGHKAANCRGPKKDANRDSAGRKETRTCYNCGKAGHIAKNCRSKKQNDNEINGMFVGMVEVGCWGDDSSQEEIEERLDDSQGISLDENPTDTDDSDQKMPAESNYSDTGAIKERDVSLTQDTDDVESVKTETRSCDSGYCQETHDSFTQKMLRQKEQEKQMAMAENSVIHYKQRNINDEHSRAIFVNQKDNQKAENSDMDISSTNTTEGREAAELSAEEVKQEDEGVGFSAPNPRAIDILNRNAVSIVPPHEIVIAEPRSSDEALHIAHREAALEQAMRRGVEMFFRPHDSQYSSRNGDIDDSVSEDLFADSSDSGTEMSGSEHGYTVYQVYNEAPDANSDVSGSGDSDDDPDGINDVDGWSDSTDSTPELLPGEYREVYDDDVTENTPSSMPGLVMDRGYGSDTTESTTGNDSDWDSMVVDDEEASGEYVPWGRYENESVSSAHHVGGVVYLNERSEYEEYMHRHNQLYWRQAMRDMHVAAQLREYAQFEYLGHDMGLNQAPIAMLDDTSDTNPNENPQDAADADAANSHREFLDHHWK